MATRGRIPLSTVLQHLDDDDICADLVADGSNDDLGMNSDYDSSVEGIFITIQSLLYYY